MYLQVLRVEFCLEQITAKSQDNLVYF